jgi:hypothetical protein
MDDDLSFGADGEEHDTLNAALLTDVSDPDMVGRSAYRAVLELAASVVLSRAYDFPGGVQWWTKEQRLGVAQSVKSELESMIEEARQLIRDIKKAKREKMR